MDPVVNRTRGGHQSATLWMGRRIMVLRRATLRTRWTLSVTRCALNLLAWDVSNRWAQGPVYSVAVSHDGQWVASGSLDKTVQFWDAKSGIVQLMLEGHTSSGPLSPRSIWVPWTHSSSVLVRSIDLSPAGSLLANSSHDNQVHICKYRYSPEFPLASIR